MLRRLNVAAGIVHEPRIVLFDEPTVGLDPQSRAAILDLVRAIAANAAVVYTTHYLDEAERLCDRLAIIAIARNERSAAFIGSGLIMLLSLFGGTFFPGEQMPPSCGTSLS